MKTITIQTRIENGEKIKQLALDFFQAVIPEPNEQLELNFK